MPRMRVMSWVLFTLAFAFFFVQDFRWSLQLPYQEARTEWTGSDVPQADLLALAERAQHSRDARSLAFVAFHVAGDQDVTFADQAVAIDPSLTWIYYGMAHRHLAANRKQPAFAPTLKAWTAKLEAFDPQNAVPYLLEAEILRDETPKFPDLYPPFTLEKGAAVSQQTAWVAAMEKAYSAPRYDSYVDRRFDLDRTIMLANGWDRPDRLIIYMSAYPIPNLLNVRSYANYKVKYLAERAEGQKHSEEAVRLYYQTALFGQRMQVEGGTLIEQLIGVAIDRIAAEPLAAALRKSGKNDQAEMVAFSDRRFRRDHPEAANRDPLANSSNQLWAILLAHILAFCTAFFWGAALLAAVYLNAKRWVRVQKRGRIFQFVTGAVNYLAVLVFVSSLALFLVTVPYFANFHYYMSAPGHIRDLEPVFLNTFPYVATDWQWGEPDILLRSVRYYLRWAGIALVLLALLGWLKKRLAPAPPTGS
jgi:hypothetical protein